MTSDAKDKPASEGTAAGLSPPSTADPALMPRRRVAPDRPPGPPWVPGGSSWAAAADDNPPARPHHGLKIVERGRS